MNVFLDKAASKI